MAIQNKNLFAAFVLPAVTSLMLLGCGGGGDYVEQQEAPLQTLAATQSEPSSVLSGKIIVGYQGWFGCPGDFEGNTKWFHWFNQIADPDRFTVDALPALSEVNDSDLCDPGLTREDGTPLRLFSSQNKNVVDAHFLWMKEHDIHGVAAQRFVSELSNPVMKRRGDNVLKNIKNAAEASGRFFYVTYDISGAQSDTVADDIRRDWQHLVTELNLTGSPAYLTDGGKPVVQFWGFGFTDRPGSVDQAASLINDFKNGSHGLQAATLIGGVPAKWRSLSGDSKADAGWAQVYRSYDVISPWAVGRYHDTQSLRAFIDTTVVPDMREAQAAGVSYLPVIFPGFSWYNLMKNRGDSVPSTLNKIPRKCGNFLWDQIAGLMSVNASMFYGAMFDEVDEATAFFKLELTKKRLVPGTAMISLDQDGCALPNNWYLSILQKGSEFLKMKQIPPADLSAVLKP